MASRRDVLGALVSWPVGRMFRDRIKADRVVLSPAVDGYSDLQSWAGALATAGGNVVTPRMFQADPNGGTSAVDALNDCIDRMNGDGATLDLSNGRWLVDGELDPINRPCIIGNGTGEILVDYEVEDGAAILDCEVPIGEVYAVSAITSTTYDFAGAYSGDTTVVRLTLSLGGGQSMPSVGAVGKLTATDAISGVESGDQVGQHIVVAAVSGSYVYIATPALFDAYSTSMQLVMLGTAPVFLGGFTMRGVWADVVADDLLYDFIRIQGAIEPQCERLCFADGPGSGLVLAGTWCAETRGIRARRLRNATASESPAIPGYGVLDAGSFGSTHQGLGGSDCRHVYTTVSPDASGWDRVAWGRTFYPRVLGGTAYGCSAAAYDVHSDCVGPEFNGLTVYGGYYGENSAGAGMQFRGVRGRMIGCRVENTAVGFELYKQFAAEPCGYELIDCHYEGAGTPIRAEHGDDLTGSDARQTITVRDFHGRTTGLIGIDLQDADLIVEGVVTIEHVGNVSTPRAIYGRAKATHRSRGGGRLVHDFSAMTDTPSPRVITFQGADCSTGGGDLNVEVRAGSVAWQAVVSENDNPAATMGAMRIRCEADTAPEAASGGYSQHGGSNLLTAGALDLRLTVAGGGQVAAKSAGFTVTAAHNGQRIPCTSALTAAVSSAAVLGPNFECWLYAVGITVTIDGPGGTNVSLTTGKAARIYTRSSVVMVDVLASADNIDVST